MNSPEKLLKESGLVTRLEGDLAWVNTANKLSCSSCRVESTCGNGILEKYLAGKIFISKIKNDLDAKVGDQVEIAIPLRSVTQASLLVYAVPLVGLFAGALLGGNLFSTEPAVIVSSALGFISGILVTYLYSQYFTGQSRFIPRMVAKIASSQPVQTLGDIKIKNL